MQRFSIVPTALVAVAVAFGCGGSTSTTVRDDSDRRDTRDPEATDNGTDVSDQDRAEHSDVQVDSGVTAGGDPTDGMAAVTASGDPTDGAAAAPPKPAPRDPRFEPSEPRQKMSAFLVEPAAEAMKKNEYELAVSYYSGLVAARGAGDPIALELAKAWRFGGQYDEAIEVYEGFAAATGDADAAARARGEARQLRNTPAPFSRQFETRPATREAIEAYNRGRKAFKKKQYADALLYYQVANQLNPDLPGPVREMGAVYQKLGVQDRTQEFYFEYLRRRPFGKLSDEVRKSLRKLDAGALGTLTVQSKLPCELLMVEKQLVSNKLPIKKVAMAPGEYTWLCVNMRYGLAYYEYARVEAGKHAELEFAWAVIINKTQQPVARIQLEDARQRGVMKDLGPFPDAEIGVLVPADGRALRLRLEAADRSGRTEERYIRLKPGQKEAITWSKR